VAQLTIHDALILRTTPEVRRLVYRLVVRILAPPEAVLHWSRWRRLHPGPRDAQPPTDTDVRNSAFGRSEDVGANERESLVRPAALLPRRALTMRERETVSTVRVVTPSPAAWSMSALLG
jgi:hypothetical protein